MDRYSTAMVAAVAAAGAGAGAVAGAGAGRGSSGVSEYNVRCNVILNCCSNFELHYIRQELASTKYSTYYIPQYCKYIHTSYCSLLRPVLPIKYLGVQVNQVLEFKLSKYLVQLRY
jgi:hypothetical protein